VGNVDPEGRGRRSFLWAGAQLLYRPLVSGRGHGMQSWPSLAGDNIGGGSVKIFEIHLGGGVETEVTLERGGKKKKIA